MGWKYGIQGHLVVGGTIGARITPNQLAPTIRILIQAFNVSVPWRHLEEDRPHGIPGDQVWVGWREGVGVCRPDWLRPHHRIRTPRHFRAGRFLKWVQSPVWNIPIAVFWDTNQVYFEWVGVIKGLSWHVFHRNSSCVVFQRFVESLESMGPYEIVPPGEQWKVTHCRKKGIRGLTCPLAPVAFYLPTEVCPVPSGAVSQYSYPRPQLVWDHLNRNYEEKLKWEPFAKHYQV